jgi:SAM-dependent methyltransferase
LATADRERWDRHYVERGAGEPGPPDSLRGREGLIRPNGSALDVACGRGESAVWLALRGCQVDAVDISPVALRAGADLARRHGVEDRIRWWEHDLDQGLPAPLAGGRTAVICQRFRDPLLYPQMVALLAPGGLLAITVLLRTDDSVHARAQPFRAEPGELRSGFDGLVVLHHAEGDGQATLVARARS